MVDIGEPGPLFIECEERTPTGPCVLGPGHPTNPIFPGHNGHMSQAAIVDNANEVAGVAIADRVSEDLGTVKAGGVVVSGAVSRDPNGMIVVDMSVVADEIERQAHARGELAPWERVIAAHAAEPGVWTYVAPTLNETETGL
jgi:hypothetical protein